MKWLKTFRGFLSVFLFLVAWPILCHRDKNLVTMIIGIVTVTEFLSPWQKFGHDDNWNCRVTNFLSSWQKFGHATIPIVIVFKLVAMTIHDDNQGCLDIDQTAVSIIKDAWTRIKFQYSSRTLGHVLNPNNHRQGRLTKHTTALIFIYY